MVNRSVKLAGTLFIDGQATEAYVTFELPEALVWNLDFRR